MGRALRLHPLLVIFGLLAGCEIYGLPGALVRCRARRGARALGVLLRAGRARAVGRRACPAPVVEVVERERRAGRERSTRDARPQRRPASRARGVAATLRRRGGALAPLDLELRRGRDDRARRAERRRQVDAASRCSPARWRRARARSSGRTGIRVGWVPQQPAHYGRLTARENLELFARLEGADDPAAAARELLEPFDLPADGVPQRPALRRQPAAAQRRDRAPRRARTCCCSTSRPRRSTRGQRRRLWETASALSRRRRRASLRDAAPRGGRVARRPRASRCATASWSPAEGALRVIDLLRKDLLVLRRSPLLLGDAGSLPAARRAARRRSSPATRTRSRASPSSTRTGCRPQVKVAGRSFDVRDRSSESATEVDLVPMSRGGGGAPARDRPGRRLGDRAGGLRGRPGRRCAARSSCSSAAAAGWRRIVTQRDAGARLQPQPRAPGRLHRGQPQVRRPDRARAGSGNFLGRDFDVLGLRRTDELLSQVPPDPRIDEVRQFVATAGLALTQTGSALRATAHADPAARGARPRAHLGCSRRRCRPTGWR